MASIRSMNRADWPAVRAIYAEGMATGQATFESEAPDWEHFDASKLADHRLVATLDEAVVGWAAVSPVSSRAVYSGVVEHSIYVAASARGHGVGKVLLQALIESTEAGSIWTIQAAIFPDNLASIRLHEALGFRVVGRRERIAKPVLGPLAGQWCDTLLIERRSNVVGL